LPLEILGQKLNQQNYFIYKSTCCAKNNFHQKFNNAVPKHCSPIGLTHYNGSRGSCIRYSLLRQNCSC